jgi:transketolase
MRAVEQVRNGICYPNLNVKVGGTHAGLETGADGATHQAIEDIAIMRSLPNLRVLVPSTPLAAEKLTRLAAEVEGPFYLRMGKDPTEELYQQDREFPLGGSIELASGDDLTIIACGNMVPWALAASGLLRDRGIGARVIDLYSIKPIDADAIVRAARETGGIVTVEDHSVLGGLGSAVAEVVTERAPTRVLRMGLRDVFGRSGTPDSLYEMFGLTPEAIARAAADFLGQLRK